jgi:sugar phosphate permease
MPQRIRHRVVFLAFLTSVLLYLDRFVLTYVERIIRLDLGLTEKQIGWGLSAFFWSYALAQVPSGLLTDRYGPRRMLTIYILLWSAGTALMGWMNSFAMLLAVRLAIGLAQAGAYPTCAAIVGRWVPLKSRGTASGLIAVGGRIGGGIAPLLTALLVMSFASDADPRIRSADITKSDAVAEKFIVEPELSPLPDASDEPDAVRWKILQRAKLSISEADSGFLLAAADDRAFALAEAERHRKSTAPETTVSGDLVTWRIAQILNEVIEGPLIATPENVRLLTVERELQSALESSPAPETIPRLNRLTLEAALPGLIRPLYSAGWRPVMWVYGAAGILIAALFWLIVRDWPAQHPRISQEELAEIDAGRPAQPTVTAQSRPPLPLGAMIRSRSLWLISGSQFFANIAWTFLVLQLPRYLQEAHHLSFADRSFYASIPLWCGWGGMFLGGIVTDRCVKRFGLRLGRVIPLAGSRLLGTSAFLGLLLEPSLPIALALLSLVAVAADFASPATWAFNQDIGGRFIASTLGWGNMWGNIGSALSPLILAEVLQRTGSWTGPFLLCASTFAIAGLCTLPLDPRKSIDVDP